MVALVCKRVIHRRLWIEWVIHFPSLLLSFPCLLVYIAAPLPSSSISRSSSAVTHTQVLELSRTSQSLALICASFSLLGGLVYLLENASLAFQQICSCLLLWKILHLPQRTTPLGALLYLNRSTGNRSRRRAGVHSATFREDLSYT